MKKNKLTPAASKPMIPKINIQIKSSVFAVAPAKIPRTPKTTSRKLYRTNDNASLSKFVSLRRREKTGNYKWRLLKIVNFIQTIVTEFNSINHGKKAHLSFGYNVFLFNIFTK
ncbi:MAG: hypothetical protein DRO63_02325 [Candidatus Gerdarchaeota archaeon]|nr:MAG: hypothetical protein DRO63_02325 [Candidatus Gerdarchaeota archaeon]